ncbi:MAG: WecB/TagA/CpsF family glycosyltransferase [Patescibacteria group bacterium]|nr:WecB/TagA/CpsF family glycosyltransferase [Candidatus Beckwithbacteria bacterium]MDZ4229093.1 WecB/TagA/CpsF family glycosyltransferase [Patescibacteria group bacterium]
MPKILGIKVDQITLPQAVSLIESWLKQKKKRYIVTPNPEMVMLAQKDKQFKRILNQADLAIPDGVGLRLADSRLRRLAGRDLMLALIKRGHKTLLVGAKPGIAQKAAETLRSVLVGKPTRTDLVGISESDIAAINRLKPDLLFVALGQVKQEKWIAKNLPKLKVKVAMGIGGALDQIAKPWLRAPLRVQALGLEWLYRLMLQPWRIKRQWQLVKFLAKIYL